MAIKPLFYLTSKLKKSNIIPRTLYFFKKTSSFTRQKNSPERDVQDQNLLSILVRIARRHK
jgi:hypothetical protein